MEPIATFPDSYVFLMQYWGTGFPLSACNSRHSKQVPPAYQLAERNALGQNKHVAPSNRQIFKYVFQFIFFTNKCSILYKRMQSQSGVFAAETNRQKNQVLQKPDSKNSDQHGPWYILNDVIHSNFKIHHWRLHHTQYHLKKTIPSHRNNLINWHSLHRIQKKTPICLLRY